MDAVTSREQSWSQSKYALLCLLLHKPAHGYELATVLARRLGGDWVVNRRSIYRMLEAFEKEGLAVSDSDEANLGRNVYAATAGAEAVVLCWMRSVAGDVPSEQMKDLQAKLAVAREQDLPALLESIDECERRCFAAKRTLESSLPQLVSPGGTLMHVAREEELDRIKAHLESLGRVRGRVRELMARAGMQP